jgi:hypothetical protein
MFDIRPLVGPFRAALHIRLAVFLAAFMFLYVVARVRALDNVTAEPAPPLSSDDILPLKRAHSHNDYEHRRPLFDALARGFSSVEADVWLSRGKLLVAHNFWQIGSSRTLASLYLEPLRKRVASNHGAVYRGSRQRVQLLIDVKSGAEDTYRVIDEQLARYASMLTSFNRGVVRQGAVTAIISGNCPRELMAAQRLRFAACDGRIEDLGSAASASLLPLISDSWGSVFDWQGDGPMPRAQRARLLSITRTAHTRGQQVRFWATPDTSQSRAQAAVWTELVAAGVDYINTDTLDALRGFLLRNDLSRAIATPWLVTPAVSAR